MKIKRGLKENDFHFHIKARMLQRGIRQEEIEYDPARDLLYVYFAEPTTKAAETVTIKPGVHADFDRGGKLIGIEIIDASEIVGGKIEFKLPEVVHSTAKL